MTASNLTNNVIIYLHVVTECTRCFNQRKERLCAVDLLVVTSYKSLAFDIPNTIYFFTKQAVLMGSSVPNLPLQLVFPVLTLSCRVFYR